MCLFSSKGKLVAEEDITVYKVLYNFAGADTFHPPYYPGYTYEKGMNLAMGKESIQRDTLKRKSNIEGVVVTQGFLHAFTNEDVACDELGCWGLYGYNYFITKLIVPKGTEYYISHNGDEICAKKLLWEDNEYNKIVKHYVSESSQ